MSEIRLLQHLPIEEVGRLLPKILQLLLELVMEVRKLGRLPVVNFAAGVRNFQPMQR